MDTHIHLREGCAPEVRGTCPEGLLKSSFQREDSQLLEAGVIQGLWGSGNQIKSNGLKTYHVPDILRES